MSEPKQATAPPPLCMLGMGWFPDQVGGLDRYYRGLLEALPQSSTAGLVIGPAADAPSNVTAVSGHSRPLPLRLLRFARAARKLTGGAAVIDAHFALYALIPWLIGGLGGKVRVVHFQGPWADENLAQGDSSAWRHWARRALERQVYRRADCVIVLSYAFKRIAVERYRISPWKVEVIAPGVDQSRFAPGDRLEARQQLGLEGSADAFVAVCIRRLVPRMGLDTLITAWAASVAQIPQGARLLIAGEGPLRDELAEQIRALGIGDSVQLLGQISDKALVDLYRAADVGVVPTLVHEGFGLIVAEAASCGTPSIVTDVGGLPEAIGSLDRSLIVPPNDAGALSERLLRAALGRELPSRSETLKFAERFGWADVAARHLKLYDRLLQRRADPRRKVVYLDHIAELSGGELALLRLLPHLEQTQPHVILGTDGPLAGRLAEAGVSCEVLPLSSSAGSLRKADVTPSRIPLSAALSTAAYTLRLARYLRRLRPALVHTNSLKAGVYGCTAARLAGVPSVWHLRDRLAIDYLPPIATKLIRCLVRTLPAAVIANSASTASTLGPAVAASKITSVIFDAYAGSHNGREIIAPAAPFTAGMVGRITPLKGQDVFLAAFADAFPNGPERAVIVGSAMFGAEEEQFADELRRIAERLGIADRTEFRGFRENVVAEMQSFDVVVHASYTEGFGQVIVEAMSAGTPVVASRAGGPEEIISDEESGLLFAPGDSHELARLMLRLSDDPSLRDSLVRGGLLRASDFDPTGIARSVEAIYQTHAAVNENREP